MVPDIAMPDYLGASNIRFITSASARFPVMMKLDAAVRLPDGVTVIAVECYVRDIDTAANLESVSQVFMRRFIPTTYGTSDILTQVFVGTSGNSPDVQVKRGSAIPAGRGLIDNNTYAYALSAEMRLTARTTDFFGVLFRGCKIIYNQMLDTADSE